MAIQVRRGEKDVLQSAIHALDELLATAGTPATAKHTIVGKKRSELKYAMYAREAIQSTALPSEALFEALRQAEEMQHCAVYGVYRPYAHLRSLDEQQLGLLRQKNGDLCVLQGF